MSVFAGDELEERDERANADRWREVSRIYGAVMAKPESDRSTALASLCANDTELRAEVDRC